MSLHIAMRRWLLCWVALAGLVMLIPANAARADDGNPLAGGGTGPAPVNPLGAPAAAATPAQDAKNGGVQTLGQFLVLGTTQTGKTLFIKLPAAQTLESAITQTADELGKILDEKPDLTGAFANGKAMTRGGALLTGKLKGQSVHGWIFAGLPKAGGGGGVTACAVIAPADVLAADVQTLFSFMPGQLNLKEYAFPDGSGSIELPPGWTTRDQTCAHGVVVVGPAGQAIAIQNRIVVSTPDGNYARLAQKNYESAMFLYDMQMKGYQDSIARHEQFPNIPVMPEPKKPEPPDLTRRYPGTIFCRVCSGADEVLKYFFPISEKMQKDAGGPYTTLEKIIEIAPADGNPLIANAKAGIAYLAVTDHNGDKATAMRVLHRIDTNPVLDGKDKWVVVFNTMRAPDASFDRDLPVMMDIMNSFKVNLNVTNQILSHEGEVIRQIGEENTRRMLQRGREFNEAQAQHIANFEAGMQAQAQARHDANSDFIEYVSGVRTVYNTRTGESAQVNLFNVNAIVNGLNAAANDPNANIQIPLRYQL